jgi:GAF domain-containing protein
MTISKDTGNATLRTIVVIGLAFVWLSMDAVDARRIWHPIGVFGYGTNVDGVVTGVDPGSPAASAGIKIGDRLDESTMTPQQLEDLIQIPAVESAGLTRTFGVFRDGVRRTVSIVSEPEHTGFGDQMIIVAGLIGALIFIGIGVVVVLLRPDLATWGFYFFCLGDAPASRTEFFSLIPSPYIQYTQIFDVLIQSAGAAGLLIFSLRFLQASHGGWRRWAQILVPFAYVGLVGFGSAEIIDTYFVARPAEGFAHARIALSAACALVVVIALIDTYVHRQGVDRQRIRWVVLGFAVALISTLTNTIITTEATNTPFVVWTVLSLLSGIAPIAVAYAIVKHRVIDVNFVVSRTLVYGILTTFFVGIFAFIDWFVGHVLDQTRWALVAEIGVAITVGFWMNGLHHRVDQFVDRVLFRRRHAAERRLARLTRGLPHATSSELVDASIVTEPRDALELTSAALFRRDGSGHYRRVTALEWPAGTTADLGSDDPLIVHLQAERGAIRLSELHWSRDGAPSDGARPALALPIMVRHELEAIALLGAHRGGEDFDPDELQWLNSLAVAAGAAYDHLAADALRQELDRVRRVSAAQQLALQEHGLLPAES